MINEDPKDAMLREYQAEILRLKMELSSGGTPNQPMNENMGQYVEEEKAKLKVFYESETQRLKAEHESQKKEKEDLMNGMSNEMD